MYFFLKKNKVSSYQENLSCFYLNKKNTYWWYIEIIKFHLVARQRKSLRTPGVGLKI
jgi:hypothetical protein